MILCIFDGEYEKNFFRSGFLDIRNLWLKKKMPKRNLKKQKFQTKTFNSIIQKPIFIDYPELANLDDYWPIMRILMFNAKFADSLKLMFEKILFSPVG